MKLWQKRMTSMSLQRFPGVWGLTFGLKSAPPFAPPMGRVVREFLKICSNPRNLSTERFTVGSNLRPPLYGPMAELNWMR